MDADVRPYQHHRRDMTGVQVSGLGNVVGGTARGLQIGAANMAIRAKGLK